MANKLSISPVERKTALCYIRKSWTFHVKEEDEIEAEGDKADKKRKGKYETDNATEQISPERQRAHIQAICDANGWIAEWYEDTEKHKSGMHEKNRPGWLALKSRMRDPDVVAIVANDLARLHRKGWRIGDLLDFVDEHGIKLVIADPRRQIDFSTPYGRMFAQLSAIFDEWYALDISERRKADIAHRKSEGKTVGLPPFGTRRNKDGYLVATQEGAWLLPDGTWIKGIVGDTPPTPDAIWRGYYDCAYRILTLYVEQVGKGQILDKLHEEGWAFRDRDGNPSPLEREDIRRVISNFAEYGGYVSRNRARERHPTEFLADEIIPKLDPERAVFDVGLLAQVAYSRQARASGRHPTHAVNRKARSYPLAGITYCAHCEQLAQKHNNPKLRSLLSGKLGKYYRHKPGVKCGTGKTMVTREKYETDFMRLVHLMELNPESFDRLLELSDHLNPPTEDLQDAEAKKEQAIALCKRRIQAAIDLFGDGRITRQEYMRRVEQNEREIVSWRAKTTDREKLVMELSMCVQAIQAMTQMWSIATDEDKQGMARHLFESITYDLGVEQIVDFKLKPWAEQFFTLRSGLYADERLVEGDGNPVALTGFEPVSSP
ncbi:MAG: recombinase family protein [Anaerolineae bacterium]|nr:recombinase family protein [Anaerolineae bacterium]